MSDENESKKHDEIPEKTSRKRRLRSVLIAAIVIGLVAAAMFGLQFSTRSLIAYDGYFHVKFSYLMGHGQGFIRNLPWLQFTVHRDFFRDHHMLFHVLYIPFTYGDLRVGGKIAAALFATMAMSAFYLVGARRDKAAAAIATLALLGAGNIFLTRMSMPRVPSLNMLFILLATHAIVTRRARWFGIVMLLFVWLYDGFAVVIPIMLAFVVADWLVARRFDWRIPAWGLGGVATGIVVNPYFPANISSYWFNLWRASGSAQLIERTGREWLPLTSWELLTQAWVIWVALAVAVLLAILRRKPTREGVALFLITVFATFLAFKAKRYLDTWPPIVMLFLVYSWADYWDERAVSEARLSPWPRRIATAALALLALYAPFAVDRQIDKFKNEREYEYFKGAAEYIAEKTADRPGTLVFNTDWDDFPFLFHFNSHNYYIVGMDQLYMIHYDKELFDLWRGICEGTVNNPAKEIAEKFGAAYAVADKQQRRGFVMRAMVERDLKKVYEDDNVVVYRVISP